MVEYNLDNHLLDHLEVHMYFHHGTLLLQCLGFVCTNLVPFLMLTSRWMGRVPHKDKARKCMSMIKMFCKTFGKEKNILSFIDNKLMVATLHPQATMFVLPLN